MLPILSFLAFLLVQNTGPVNVQKITTPEKALRFEVMVPAPLDEVWAAFTTEAGLEAWLWKDIRVDARPGGDWIVLYPGGKTGGGTIVSITPRRRVVIRALAPEQFPTVRREGTDVTFSFDSSGPAATKVTLTQTGWKTGDEWNAAYEYLAKGNAQLLTQLHQRFTSGPLDWSKFK